MILGECPYEECNGPLMIGIPDLKLPVFASHPCESCGKTIWTKFSRFDPQSWTEEGFKEDFILDENNKTVTAARLDV